MNLPISSHTFLNDWDNCPHKAFRKFIKKDLPKGPQTDAMKWGNEVHSAFDTVATVAVIFKPQVQPPPPPTAADGKLPEHESQAPDIALTEAIPEGMAKA